MTIISAGLPSDFLWTYSCCWWCRCSFTGGRVSRSERSRHASMLHTRRPTILLARKTVMYALLRVLNTPRPVAGLIWDRESRREERTHREASTGSERDTRAYSFNVPIPYALTIYTYISFVSMASWISHSSAKFERNIYDDLTPREVQFPVTTKKSY